MRHLTYLALLAGCLLGTAPLEIWLSTRVYARTGRWLLALAPTFVAFTFWDAYAISRHHWAYQQRWMSQVVLPFGVPLEEALFFVVVPTCAILAFEAVRSVKGWRAGDEPATPDGRAEGPPCGHAPGRRADEPEGGRA